MASLAIKSDYRDFSTGLRSSLIFLISTAPPANSTHICYKYHRRTMPTTQGRLIMTRATAKGSDDNTNLPVTSSRRQVGLQHNPPTPEATTDPKRARTHAVTPSDKRVPPDPDITMTETGKALSPTPEKDHRQAGNKGPRR